MPIAVALLVALLIGGGVSAGAQGAKPGDLLYGFKLNMNEKIGAAFAGSDENKANVETKLAEKRLEETEEEAARATLSADVRQQIEDNFAAHADRVQELIASFQAKEDFKNAADIAVRLQASLNAHARILARLSETTTEPAEREELNKIKAKVDAEDKQTSDMDKDVQTDVEKQGAPDVQAAAEGRMGAAENKIKEVQAFMELMKATAGADATANAQAHLVLAQKSFADGQVKLGAKVYADAFALFSQSLRHAQEAKAFMQAKVDLDVEVNDNEDIEGNPVEAGEGARERAREDAEVKLRVNL